MAETDERSVQVGDIAQVSGTVIVAGRDVTVYATPLGPAAGAPPYKGLQAYDIGDEGLFFGRAALSGDLTRRLAVHGERFLAVVGASGSGKSSLVRAGVLPTLVREHGWRVFVFTPGADPLARLAEAITPGLAGMTAGQVYRRLADDVNGLLGELAAAGPALILADQFEELFTQTADAVQRQAAIDVLLAASAHVAVVLTVRADFFDACLQYEALRGRLEAGQALIGRMTPDELRAAILGPAENYGWTVEAGLADQMLTDLGDAPGALPLLSHALLETWRNRTGTQLTLAGYAQAGGVEGAIAKTAEATFNQLDAAQQGLARNVFLRLTALGEGTADTRRRVARAELPGDVAGVLAALADARLITTDEDAVDVAHEALIQRWPRLQGWLRENREGLLIHRRLTDAANGWQAAGRSAEYLFSGTRLAQTGEWAVRTTDVLNETEQAFLAAGQRRQAHERRQRQFVQWGVVGLLALLVLVLGGSTILFNQQAAENARLADAAETSAAEAEQAAMAAEQSAGEARSIAVAAQAELEIQAGRPLVGIALALAALKELPYTPQAELTLYRAILADPSKAILAGPDGGTWAVAALSFSPRVLTGGADDTLRMWNGLTGELLGEWPAEQGGVWVIAISPDGTWWATGGVDGSVVIWDAATGTVLHRLEGHRTTVTSLAWHGTFVTSVDTQGEIIDWDAERGRESLRWETGGDADDYFLGWLEESEFSRLLVADRFGQIDVVPAFNTDYLPDLTYPLGIDITGVAFSPTRNDTLAVVAGLGGDVQVTDYSGATPFSPPPFWRTTPVIDVVWGEVGIITAHWEGALRLWDSSAFGTNADGSKPPLRAYLGHNTDYNLTDIDLSRDAQWLVSASSLGDARVWQVNGQQATFAWPVGYGGPVQALTADPGGAWFATVDAYSTWVDVYDLQAGTKREVLADLNTPSEVVAWPGRNSVVVGTFEGELVEVSVATGERVQVFTELGGPGITAVVVSADGTRIAAASGGGDVWLWAGDDGGLTWQIVHDEIVNGLAFTADGASLIGFDASDRVTAWSAADGSVVTTLTSPQAQSLFYGATSPDGRWLVAAEGNTGGVYLWDGLSSPTPVATAEFGASAVRAVAFSPDSTRLLVALTDGTVRVVRVPDLVEVQRIDDHSGWVESVAWSADGAWIAAGGDDGYVRLYPAATTLQGLFALAEGHQPPVLTPEQRVQAGLPTDR